MTSAIRISIFGTILLSTMFILFFYATPVASANDAGDQSTVESPLVSKSALQQRLNQLLQQLQLLLQLRDLLVSQGTWQGAIDSDETVVADTDEIIDMMITEDVADIDDSDPPVVEDTDSDRAQYVGVHYDFLWERQGDTVAEKEEDLEFLAAQVDNLGVGIVRMPIRWLALYDKPGISCENQTLKPWVLDSYEDILNALPSDVAVVAYLDSPPASCKSLYKSDKVAFADKYQEYVSAVVAEFDDRIDYWEVWNEPNNYPTAMINPDGTMWSGEDYVKYVLQPGYRGVSAMSRDDVLLGGMSYNGIIAHYERGVPTSYTDWYLAPNFLEEIYNSGGKNYFDIMAIHPYMQLPNPDSNGIDNNGEFESVGGGVYLVPSMAQVDNDEQLADLMRQYGDGHKEVWWTEFGVRPVYAGSEYEQADMTEGAMQAAWESRDRTYAPVTKAIVYTLRDSFRGEKEFGLLRQDNTERPVFETVQDFFTD